MDLNRAVLSIRVFFTGLALSLDPMLSRISPCASAFADAIEAIIQAARAARRRFGRRSAWQFASGATAGGLLATRVGAFRLRCEPRILPLDIQ